MEGFTHLDRKGQARMVDISQKAVTHREAIARGAVYMQAQTFERIQHQGIEKGDVLGVAKIAGIMAAKKTAEIIPMCHPLELTGVDLTFTPLAESGGIGIEARVKTVGKTGVEMEALVAVGAAALTIYDMCKAVDRGMVITDIRLIKKSGGKSGEYVRRDGELGRDASPAAPRPARK